MNIVPLTHGRITLLLGLTAALFLLHSRPVGAVAIGDAYDDHEAYWCDVGSGGSIRGADSRIHIDRSSDPFTGQKVTGQSSTYAKKDYFCANSHSLPPGYIFAFVEVLEWSNGKYVQRVMDAGYNSSSSPWMVASATCYSCNHSSKVNSAHKVNSLGSWHPNLMTTPIIAP